MTKNMTAGGLALVLGLLYLFSATQIPVLDAGDVVGPRAFPYLISFVVIASSLGLLVKEFRNGDRKPFSWRFTEDRGVWLRILATMAAGIVYGLVLDWLGYLIATLIFMGFVTSLINPGKHVQNALISVIFSIVTFVSFALVLKLSLPRGILGGVLPF